MDYEGGMTQWFTQQQVEELIEASVAPLRTKISELVAQVERLAAENAQLKKNSSTSSKPPSSDIVKPKKPALKGGKKRKRGGQPGHDQHLRSPFPPEAVNEFLPYTLDCCPDCGGTLVLSRREPEVLQQVEVAACPTSITEHQGLAYWCPHCRKFHYAPLPEAIEKAGLFGPRLTALVAFMKGVCHASFSTIRKFLRDVVRVDVCRGYAQVPDVITSALMRLIDRENLELGRLCMLRRVALCWDQRLSQALLAKAKDDALKPECLGDLLADLVKHQCSDAQQFAESLVGNPPPTEDLPRRKAVEAATALWSCAQDCGWSKLWPAFQADPEFGKEVLTKVAHERRHQVFSTKNLSDGQLVDLFLWLSAQYPHSEDPADDGADPSGTRESVVGYRESILDILKTRGTLGACQAIQTLIASLPNLAHLKWVLRAARQFALRATWRPLTPEQLLELTRVPRSRLVQSADALLNVVIESIDSLQQDLQGETPASRDIWDHQANGGWRPVDENDLSDYVTRYLQKDLKQRGIVALREVKILRGRGNARGEVTDIHIAGVVEGLTPGAFDTVRVIVETKGCWNGSLKTAMKTQLLDRYLKDNDCQQGLYLVGWFNCEQWDPDDNRRAKAPKCILEEARDWFAKQATRLSGERAVLRSFVLNCALP